MAGIQNFTGKLFDAQDISSSATSDHMSTDGAYCLAVHLFSASAARGGTVEIQSSNDGTNWVSETLAGGGTTLTITAAAAFDAMEHFYGFGARFLRVKFTDSASGAGTLTVIVNKQPTSR